MHTLQEFLHYTKSISYLLAVIMLLSSIPFWSLLTEREPKD